MQNVGKYSLLICVAGILLATHDAVAQQENARSLAEKGLFHVSVTHIKKGTIFPSPLYSELLCKNILSSWSNQLIKHPSFKKSFPITDGNLGLSGALAMEIDKSGIVSRVFKPVKSAKVSNYVYESIYNCIIKSEWKPLYVKQGQKTVPLAANVDLRYYISPSYDLAVKFVYNDYSYVFFKCGQ